MHLSSYLSWCTYDVHQFQRSLAYAACAYYRTRFTVRNEREQDEEFTPSLDLFNEDYDIHNDGSYANAIMGFESTHKPDDYYAYLIHAASLNAPAYDWNKLYLLVDSKQQAWNTPERATWLALAQQIDAFKDIPQASRITRERELMQIQIKADTLSELEYRCKEINAHPDLLADLPQEAEYDLLQRYVAHLERIRTFLLNNALRSCSQPYAHIEYRAKLERFMRHYHETRQLHIAF